MHALSYIYKRVPHSSVKGKTPFEAYFRHKPDVSNLWVFGSTAWGRIPLDKRRALQPQIIECLFIGNPDESKDFKLLDIKTKYIIIERSVKFDEPLQEVELVKEKTAEFPSYSTEYLDDEIGGDDPDLDPIISNIVCRNHHMLNQNLKCKIIFLHGPNRHSPPQEKTLEIRMIQGEPGLISKEQVLRSLVLIIFYMKLSI